jgi:hypothetical protein
MKDADLLFPAKLMYCAKFAFIGGLDLLNAGSPHSLDRRNAQQKETHSAPGGDTIM